MRTIGEVYGPAMEIKDQAEATAWFDAEMLKHSTLWGKTLKEAAAEIRSNLGYYAGYYDNDTRRRVEKLFSCSHPVFGSIEKNGTPTSDEALAAGAAAGEKRR